LWRYPGQDPRQLSPAVLAYVGDAVYELYVRIYLIDKGLSKAKRLHEEASGLVRAAKQADFLHRLESVLSEEEKDVARRGRNSKTGHYPKSSGVVEYRLSTGFEALLGYLFLLRREDRIGQLLEYLFGAFDTIGDGEIKTSLD